MWSQWVTGTVIHADPVRSWWQIVRSDRTLESLFVRKYKCKYPNAFERPVCVCCCSYLPALQPKLSSAQPGRDRWGVKTTKEPHEAPCPARSSPSFPSSSSLLPSSTFSPCCPSHFAGCTGHFAALLPAVRRSLFACLLSHTDVLFLTLTYSLSCLPLPVWSSVYLRWWVHGRKSGCGQKSSFLHHHHLLKKAAPSSSSSLPLLLFASVLTHLCSFVGLTQRGRKYCINVFLHFLLFQSH